MKKLSTLFILLFCAVSSTVWAQQTKEPTLTVMYGSIPPKYVDGKPVPNEVSKELVLRNGTLNMPPPPCDVTEFQISFMPKGANFIGPFTVKGNQLTPAILKKIEAINEPECKIFIENIKVSCSGKEMKGKPILMKMVNTK